VNESGASVVLDANTLKVVESSGVYTFVDAAGATVAVIDTNVSSSDVSFDNSGSSLTSTDVESALKELESLIGNLQNTDEQQLQNFRIQGNNLEITIERGNTVSVPLADLIAAIDSDAQTIETFSIDRSEEHTSELQS